MTTDNHPHRSLQYRRRSLPATGSRNRTERSRERCAADRSSNEYYVDRYYMRCIKDLLRDAATQQQQQQPPRRPTPPAEPARLTEHVYLGSQRNADDCDLLRRIGITHVLSCANTRRANADGVPYSLAETGVRGFLLVPAEDREDFDIARFFDATIRFLSNVKTEGGRALVHCSMGVNRSAAIVAAYLMADMGWNLLTVVAYLKRKRQHVLTNKGFRRQLIDFARQRGYLDIDGVLRASSTADGWAVPDERMATTPRRRQDDGVDEDGDQAEERVRRKSLGEKDRRRRISRETRETAEEESGGSLHVTRSVGQLATLASSTDGACRRRRIRRNDDDVVDDDVSKDAGDRIMMMNGNGNAETRRRIYRVQLHYEVANGIASKNGKQFSDASPELDHPHRYHQPHQQQQQQEFSRDADRSLTREPQRYSDKNSHFLPVNHVADNLNNNNNNNNNKKSTPCGYLVLVQRKTKPV